ncbi:ArsR/SmtB family transcription factor [Arthrobacter sp. NPDC058192]|uniref:ArsR/SmtB family transcription factor n=1 Tax=Arthrobacter sp. NPDC058192 TaxID=3346372 RepID=UPI0036ED9C8D
MIGPAQAADMLAAAEAELFKALAHPARARVVGVLALGPSSVPDLCEATGLKPSHLAGHLAQLRAQHLVTGKRAGGRLLYRLSFPEVARILSEADAVLSVRAAAEADGLTAMSAPETAPRDTENEDVGALVEELVPRLEQSLERRALIAAAVESVSVRTGRSSEAALAALLSEARERGRTLAETASDAVAGNVTE